jgi:drug/metabolite transporter (DMT)-like permease
MILGPAAAAATTGVLVGAAIVATRSVVDQASPASLAFLRYLVGGALLVPVALASRRIRIRLGDMLPVALLGVGQFGLLVVLLNISLQFVPAARAALIFATMPVLTMLLGWLSGREGLAARQTLAVVLTIGGVAAVVGADVSSSAASSRPWLGDLAALGSAVTGAVCSLLYRPYLRRNSALAVGALAMAASVPVLALLAARDGFFATAPAFTPAGWLAVVFIGIGSALGYALWLWALRRLAATNVTVYLALGPVTAAVLGAVLLDEPVTLLLALGTGLVGLGLWAALRYSAESAGLATTAG